MRVSFAKNHLTSLVTDFYTDFYSSALRTWSNYIFNFDRPRLDSSDEYFIDRMRRSYKEYSAFMNKDEYFDHCFTFQNVGSVDYMFVRLKVVTRVNMLAIVPFCNSSQVIPMLIFMVRLFQKELADLETDNPGSKYQMGDLTIHVLKISKNEKFLSNGLMGDLLKLSMDSYVSDTKRKGNITLIRLDYRELVRRWQVLRHWNYPDAKVWPDSHYYKYFRNPRQVERIKRLKGSLMVG